MSDKGIIDIANPNLFGCPIPKTGDPYEDARAPVLWILSELQKQYQEAAKPYLDRLALIEMCRPQSYVDALEHIVSVADEAIANNAEGNNKTRTAYICIHCEGVYADAPVSKCDCMQGSGHDFVTGTITYQARNAEGGAM